MFSELNKKHRTLTYRTQSLYHSYHLIPDKLPELWQKLVLPPIKDALAFSGY